MGMALSTKGFDFLAQPIAGSSVATGRQDQVNGKTYEFAENSDKAQRVSFSFTDDICGLTFVEDGKTIRFSSGSGHWITDGEKPGNSLFALRGRTPKETAISSYYYIIGAIRTRWW
jgi:hypothetical protein